MLRIGSIFSGIGGIELGLERAGLGHTVFHAETDPYCSRVLERHWPGVPNLGDVRNVTGDVPAFDLLAGGFPCQPTSQAAARSRRGTGWLWPEFARIIREYRPPWVVIENPESLRYANRGLSEVLGDLAEMGFDAEWRVVRASWFGAPHHRARIWVVAHSHKNGEPARPLDEKAPILSCPTTIVPGWEPLPGLSMDDGVPLGLATRALGNAVVPQCAEFVGLCIKRAMCSEG